MTTALVFGSAGGIGSAAVQSLRATGARVLGVSRHGAGADETAADLGDEQQVAEACLWAAREASTIDVVVFAAGRMASGLDVNVTSEQFRRVWIDNVLAAQVVTRHVAPLLGPTSHRIFLGAFVEKLHFPKLGAYASAKAALDAWVRVLLREERSIKTTLLRLPAVESPLWKQAPFPLPAGALSPVAVGERIVRCWREETVGVVDMP